VPDSWNLMAARRIEIVAAAEGTIVFKADGNFDQNCRVQHRQLERGVRAARRRLDRVVRAHEKRLAHDQGRGQRVAVGEYLGNVGSSGNSTGPHLHFEVYDASARLIDPYAGACNRRNSESWWERNRRTCRRASPAFPPRAAQPETPTSAARTGAWPLPASTTTRRTFRPGDVLWIVANVRDHADGRVGRVHGALARRRDLRADRARAAAEAILHRLDVVGELHAFPRTRSWARG
jgi:hypothetical protein